MDHPNILRMIEFYEDNANFYIITELCNIKLTYLTTIIGNVKHNN